jgi:hypothetical protein
VAYALKYERAYALKSERVKAKEAKKYRVDLYFTLLSPRKKDMIWCDSKGLPSLRIRKNILVNQNIHPLSSNGV